MSVFGILSKSWKYNLHQQGSDFGITGFSPDLPRVPDALHFRGMWFHRFVSSVITCPINTYRILHGKDSKSHNNCSLNSCCFWRRVKGWYSKTNLSTSIKVRRSTGIGMTIQEQSHLLLPHLLIETFKPRLLNDRFLSQYHHAGSVTWMK